MCKLIRMHRYRMLFLLRAPCFVLHITQLPTDWLKIHYAYCTLLLCFVCKPHRQPYLCMVQVKACGAATRLQDAEEKMLELQMATAEARIQLSSPDVDGAFSLPESAWSDQGTLDQARRKRQRAHRALKELRETRAQRSAQRAVQATNAGRQLDESVSELHRNYNRMFRGEPVTCC